jgi:hypothetical protein
VFMAARAFGGNQFMSYGTTAYQGFMHIRYCCPSAESVVDPKQ